MLILSNLTQQRNNYFIVAFIFSLIGAIVLLFGGFGWWSNYYSYSGVREHGWIGISLDQPLSSVIIIFVALCMLYGSYIAFLGFQNKIEFNLLEKNILRALIASAIALGIVIIGGIIFVLSVFDADYWDFDPGFYGGLVGSAVELLMFYLIQKSLKLDN